MVLLPKGKKARKNFDVFRKLFYGSSTREHFLTFEMIHKWIETL